MLLFHLAHNHIVANQLVKSKHRRGFHCIRNTTVYQDAGLEKSMVCGHSALPDAFIEWGISLSPTSE